jgi:hypothetical protein
MTQTRNRFEQLRRWRQVAVWAPVLWFPLLVHFFLLGSEALAIGLGLAGIAFAVFARGRVWIARCPACHEPFRSSEDGFRRIWDESTCGACGLSLFEMRRGVGGVTQR